MYSNDFHPADMVHGATVDIQNMLGDIVAETEWQELFARLLKIARGACETGQNSCLFP